MKVIILYQELAGYILSCMHQTVKEYGVEFHVVSLPINKEAPFQFENTQGIYHYSRKDMHYTDLCALVDKVQPSAIYCAGWIDKDYLKVVQRYKHITSLLGFDNQWHGTLKQQLATVYGHLKLKPLFDFAFVPGQKQLLFAQKLGFKKEQVLTGIYSADVEVFNVYYQAAKPSNKTFLYVGRYVQQKNIEMLWQAFIEILPEIGNDWKLMCAGTGDIAPLQHPNILHKGFVQPKDFKSILDQSDIYLLPSTFEPWGVSAHEMACAGFPMILSKEVGASEVFLEDGKNGFLFHPTDKEELKRKMKLMASLNDNDLQKMREHSHALGQKITPSTWARQLMRAMGR
jgi:glycosyltransferase involved in cell wall biosynthesis